MLGIIGGTGLYRLEGLTILGEKKCDTPFGEPSSAVIYGRWGNQEVRFLARHGTSHSLLPSEINYRANIWALKASGVLGIISLSATGSLREALRPGDMGLVSQYFDWTRGRRASSFFGDGMVAHVSTAQPSCPVLRAHIKQCARKNGVELRDDLVYATVEGPRLGTKAESHFLRQSGCDLVGMTNVPESFLALEAQLGYVTLGIVTDYDCWLEDPNQHASSSEIMAFYQRNIGRVLELLGSVLSEPVDLSKSPSRTALKHAVVTSPESLSPEKRKILEFLQQ